jgi:hypothetical protein
VASLLYRDGLGGHPDLAGMALWLAKGKNVAARAKALTAVAKRAEALERTLLAVPDAQATYRRWVAVNDSLGNADRVAIRAHIAGLPYRPLISAVMALGKATEAALNESFNSVITVYRRSLIEAVGCLRAGFEGASFTTWRCTRTGTKSGCRAKAWAATRSRGYCVTVSLSFFSTSTISYFVPPEGAGLE